MIRRYIWLCAIMATMTTAARAELTAQRFTPEWKVGSTWTIQSSFRNMDAADSAGTSWSAPVNFQYTVTGARAIAEGTEYTIHAEPKEPGTGFATTLTVLADSAGHTAIQSVDAQHRRYGQTVTDRTTYGGAPAFTDNSIIPYDAPVFPLERPNSLHVATFVSPIKSFTRVRDVGGLFFAQHPSQRLKSLNGSSTYVDRRGETVTFKAPVASRDVFPVELEEAGTGQHVVQYWAQGQPWFVYSENNSSRSWLVAQ